MPRRRSRKLPRATDVEAVAGGQAQLAPRALCRLIRAVNPTRRGLEPEERRRRYALKARLQSLGVRQLEDVLHVRLTDEEGIVGLGLRRDGSAPARDDLGHARLDALDDDARARVLALLGRLPAPDR